MEMSDSEIDELLSEGKTKQVYRIKKNGYKNDLVYIVNKDNISAGDNSRCRRIMEGKARISVETSSAIFNYLNAIGIKTAFVSKVKSPSKHFEKSFVAKYCQMIPIELVVRRLATGTFLKLNPHVSEGFRFRSPKIEIHIKDDLNHDPLWSIETFIAAKFKINGLLIGENEIKSIFKLTQLVFEVLEKIWKSIDYQLVDLKVEFGVISDENHNKSIVLADIIDNETWRLWPNSDRKLMVDKQIYREYKDEQIDDKVIDHVRNVFQSVADLTQQLFNSSIVQSNQVKRGTVIIVVQNHNNLVLTQQLIKCLASDYGIIDVNMIRIGSLMESFSELHQLIDNINETNKCEVIVTIADKNPTLGSIISSNTAIPVIEYINRENFNFYNEREIKTLLSINCENTCLSVAKIVANNNLFVWSKIKTNQCYNCIENMIQSNLKTE